jgi:hypothetical protein
MKLVTVLCKGSLAGCHVLQNRVMIRKFVRSWGTPGGSVRSVNEVARKGRSHKKRKWRRSNQFEWRGWHSGWRSAVRLIIVFDIILDQDERISNGIGFVPFIPVDRAK